MKLSIGRNLQNVPPEQMFLGILLFIMLAMSFLQVKEGFEHGKAMAAAKKPEGEAQQKPANLAAAAAMMVPSQPPAGGGGVTQQEPFSLYRS